MWGLIAWVLDRAKKRVSDLNLNARKQKSYRCGCIENFGFHVLVRGGRPRRRDSGSINGLLPGALESLD